MPVVAVPAVAAAMLALLALLILWGAKAFGRALASFIPTDLPLLGARLHNLILAIATLAEAAVTWIMADFIRPVINLFLGPVFAVWNFIDSVYGLARTMAASWSWLLNDAIPAVIRKLEGYAHGLYVAAEHYARRIVDAAVSSLERLVNLARSYAHSLYVAAEHYARRIVDAATAALNAAISKVQTYAHDLYAASEHYAQRIVGTLRADVAKDLKAIEAELSTVAGVSTSYIATQIADALKAAETQSVAAVAAGISAVDIDVETTIAGLFDGLITDVGALEGVIATDLPDIGAAIRAIPRAIPTDLAGDIALSLSVAVPMLRYMRECGIPNCRNLSSFGRFLKGLEDLVGGGLFLALLVELISDPEGAAREVQSFLGPIVDDTAGLARNLLGV